LLDLAERIARALPRLFKPGPGLALCLFELRLRVGPGLFLGAGAFLDQRFEEAAAFLLRLGEGAEAGQPDLLRGIDHRAADRARLVGAVARRLAVVIVHARAPVADECRQCTPFVVQVPASSRARVKSSRHSAGPVSAVRSRQCCRNSARGSVVAPMRSKCGLDTCASSRGKPVRRRQRESAISAVLDASVTRENMDSALNARPIATP